MTRIEWNNYGTKNYRPQSTEVACIEGDANISDAELLAALRAESEHYADYTVERLQADKAAELIEWAHGWWTGRAEHQIWFAALRHNDDDCDNGSFELGEAVEMALEYRAEGDLGAFVAVFDVNLDDIAFCLDEIHEF